MPAKPDQADSKLMLNARPADTEIVTSVTHYDDRLFSFRTTRPKSLRFRSGEFVMIGLLGENGKPILRAYSIASPSWDEELEFYSIKVQDGPLTSKLQNIQAGDQLILRPKPVGTLVVDALLPGKRLFMFATGTGIAPFASLVRDPEVYEKFEEVVLLHTCRKNSEHIYGKTLINALGDDPLIGEFASKLIYHPTTTREESEFMGRNTDLVRSGEAYSRLGIAPIDAAEDRAMVCGSMALNLELKELLESYGMREGANSEPAEYVVEKAFVGDGV